MVKWDIEVRWSPHRKLPCNSIEANMNGVFKVWGQRDLRTLLLLLLVCCNMKRGENHQSLKVLETHPVWERVVLLVTVSGATHSCPRRGKWSAGGPSCFSLREPWAAVWRRDWATRSPGSYCSFSGAAPAVSPQYRHYQTSLAALTKSWEKEIQRKTWRVNISRRVTETLNAAHLALCLEPPAGRFKPQFKAKAPAAHVQSCMKTV